MAKQTLNTIKGWFRTAFKPTQAQFWDTWDSFFHKDEKIPFGSIENIEQRFNEKADAELLTNHIIDPDAHGIGNLLNLVKRPDPISVTGETVYKLDWTPERMLKYGKYTRASAQILVPDTEIWKPVADYRMEYNEDGSTKSIEWDLDGFEAKIFEN